MVEAPKITSMRSVGHRIRRFVGDRSGNVAILAAFSIVPLMATVGVATDSARGYLLNNRLQEAIDIAALAAARGEGDEAARQAIMEQYFWANYPTDYLGATVSGPFLDPISDDQIRVTVSVSMPNTFLQVIDIDSTTISASTVVQKERRGMELVLVMDNTGSMRLTDADGESRIDAMQTAATGLVNTLYDGEETVEDFWVGVVPYQATVNIGYDNTGWLQTGSLDVRDSYFIDPDREDYRPRYSGSDWSDRSYFRPGGSSDPSAYVGLNSAFIADMYRMFELGDANYNPVPLGWKGCVEARHTWDRDQTDDPPSVESFTPYYSPSASDNEWCRIDDEDGDYCSNPMTPPHSGTERLLIQIDERNSATLDREALGPNRGCPQAILPLVASKQQVIDAIEEMQPWRYGGTFGNLGLAWGWRVISPRWRDLWDRSPDGMPLDYDTPLMDKVVIMLTDGENRFSGDDYSAYGRPDEDRIALSNHADELDRRMAAICEAMKDEGIILYTITFQVTDDDTHDLYRDCATSVDHYFDSPSNDELQTTFDIIAGQLSNLRLAQ